MVVEGVIDLSFFNDWRDDGGNPDPVPVKLKCYLTGVRGSVSRDGGGTWMES
jgi:hypothetical protein